MTSQPLTPSPAAIRLGLRENWRQFSLLILINAFVGGMVGLERTVVPLIGSEEFKIASTTVVVSFIVSFGVVKALANLVSGHFADVYGRKAMLVIGWLVGLPVPFMIGWGPSWGWIVAANALLGVNQGFAWSMTVIMKIDLVGPKSRGLAVGLNEFAGYLSVGLTAFLTGYIAAALRPAPGAVLSRHRLRRSRSRAVRPARRRHAPSCRPRTRPITRPPRSLLGSGRSFAARRSATVISSPPRRPGSSTISTTG